MLDINYSKLAVFTDIHFGKRQNSETHNLDCLAFIDWFISQAKEFGSEVVVFCGDFNDVRASINIKTMNYSILAIEKLAANFKKVYFILGNHDLYHRNNLDIHSLKYGKHIKNVEIIDKITTVEHFTMVPWLVNNEWEKLKEIKSKYVFAHIELPNFFMNSMSVMPDHGGLNAEMFDGPEYIFSGHFHKRQTYKNLNKTEVIYIGNTFPHNYSDANDFERGCMMLEIDKPPLFLNWADCPKYLTCCLSDLLEKPDNYLAQKNSIRATNDLELSYDEVSFIKETLTKTFGCRELLIVPKKIEDYDFDIEDSMLDFKSVDNIVFEHINALQSKTFQKDVLLKIYKEI